MDGKLGMNTRNGGKAPGNGDLRTRNGGKIWEMGNEGERREIVGI